MAIGRDFVAMIRWKQFALAGIVTFALACSSGPGGGRRYDGPGPVELHGHITTKSGAGPELEKVFHEVQSVDYPLRKGGEVSGRAGQRTRRSGGSLRSGPRWTARRVRAASPGLPAGLSSAIILAVGRLCVTGRLGRVLARYIRAAGGEPAVISSEADHSR